MGSKNILLFLLMLWTLTTFPVSAMLVSVTPEKLSANSDAVIIGEAQDVSSSWDSGHKNIITTTTFKVDQTLKGQNQGDLVKIKTPGGTVGGTTQWVEDAPVFSQGYRYGLFLKSNENGVFSPSGMNNGVFSLCSSISGLSASTSSKGMTDQDFEALFNGKSNGTTSLMQFIPGAGNASVGASAIPVITSVKPTAASAGTDTQITIKGSGFGTKESSESLADVLFLYKRTSAGVIPIFASGAPFVGINSYDIVSWSDTEITVHVPIGYTADGYPGSASSGWLTVLTDEGALSEKYPFTVTFSYGKEHWSFSDPVAIYSVNEGTVTGSAAAVQKAGNVWNKADSAFQYKYGGISTSTTFGQDGQNLIYFGPKSDFSDDSIIAMSTYWSVDGIITEADIEFNSGWSWTTGNATGEQMNVETVVLHEMGHWLSLRDLYGMEPEYGYSSYPSDISPVKKVMFGYNDAILGNKNLITLSTPDIAGIRYIYSSSPSLGAGFTASPVEGYPSLTVHFTDGSSGYPDTWKWNFGDGGGSALQNPNHTYAIPGKYSVNLTIGKDGQSSFIEKQNLITVKIPQVKINPFPRPEGGFYPVPTDPDDDGRYEDINGNGWLEFEDPLVLLKNMQFAMTKESVLPFDFDSSGFIGYGDVVALQKMV